MTTAAKTLISEGFRQLELNRIQAIVQKIASYFKGHFLFIGHTATVPLRLTGGYLHWEK